MVVRGPAQEFLCLAAPACVTGNLRLASVFPTARVRASAPQSATMARMSSSTLPTRALTVGQRRLRLAVDLQMHQRFRAPSPMADSLPVFVARQAQHRMAQQCTPMPSRPAPWSPESTRNGMSSLIICTRCGRRLPPSFSWSG